jgi:hypothetical protein
MPPIAWYASVVILRHTEVSTMHEDSSVEIEVVGGNSGLC